MNAAVRARQLNTNCVGVEADSVGDEGAIVLILSALYPTTSGRTL